VSVQSIGFGCFTTFCVLQTKFFLALTLSKEVNLLLVVGVPVAYRLSKGTGEVAGHLATSMHDFRSHNQSTH
jgi:hypothetical protein